MAGHVPNNMGVLEDDPVEEAWSAVSHALVVADWSQSIGIKVSWMGP